MSGPLTGLTVVEMDTASDSSVQAAAAQIVEKFGRAPAPLYAIVNNAGIASGTVSEILNVNVQHRTVSLYTVARLSDRRWTKPCSWAK